MDTLKPDFPTEKEIKTDLAKRGLSNPDLNWWVIVTRYHTFAYQTRSEAECQHETFCEKEIEHRIYILKIGGNLLNATMSFEFPKPKPKGFFKSFIDSLSTLF